MNLLDSDFLSTRLTKFKIDNVIQKCAIKLSHDPFDFTIHFITVFMEVGNIKGSFSFFNDLEYCLLQMLNRNGINIKHDEIKKRSSLNSTVFAFYVDTKCEGVLQNNYVLYANRFFDNSILKNFRISPNSFFF